MNNPINLASLPKEEALALALAGGRAIFGDVGAVTHIYTEMMSHWIARNIPKAVGQSDDEFGDLVSEVEKEFNAGVDEAVRAAQTASPLTSIARDGEMAAGSAQLIVRALQWIHNNVQVDTAREDIDDYQTLVELGLSALEKELQVAEQALIACRWRQASSCNPVTPRTSVDTSAHATVSHISANGENHG